MRSFFCWSIWFLIFFQNDMTSALWPQPAGHRQPEGRRGVLPAAERPGGPGGREPPRPRPARRRPPARPPLRRPVLAGERALEPARPGTRPCQDQSVLKTEKGREGRAPQLPGGFPGCLPGCGGAPGVAWSAGRCASRPLRWRTRARTTRRGHADGLLSRPPEPPRPPAAPRAPARRPALTIPSSSTLSHRQPPPDQPTQAGWVATRFA